MTLLLFGAFVSEISQFASSSIDYDGNSKLVHETFFSLFPTEINVMFPLTPLVLGVANPGKEY